MLEAVTTKKDYHHKLFNVLIISTAGAVIYTNCSLIVAKSKHKYSILFELVNILLYYQISVVSSLPFYVARSRV